MLCVYFLDDDISCYQSISLSFRLLLINDIDKEGNEAENKKRHSSDDFICGCRLNFNSLSRFKMCRHFIANRNQLLVIHQRKLGDN